MNCGESKCRGYITVNLLKQIVLQRMNESDDIRSHLRKFCGAVDRLSDMEVPINNDLLSILLVYSLPASFDSFRIAIVKTNLNVISAESRVTKHRNVDDLWIEVMVDEFCSLLEKDVWDLVERSGDHSTVGSRTILRNKRVADGSVIKRKATVVARGFSQRPGMDYNETYAPVARFSSIRVAMAFAAEHNRLLQWHHRRENSKWRSRSALKKC